MSREGTTVASLGVVDIFEPGATLFGGKYRLERLVLANGGVMVWEALDLHSGREVQLSVFAHGSTMLDHGRIDSGTFVVFDVPPRAAPRLELVEVSDEDAFFDEPPAPELFDVPAATRRRPWLLGVVAVVAGALFAVGALYVSRARTVATSEATITAAPIPVPKIETPQAPPPPPPAVPSAVPERHETPAPHVSPAPKPLPKRWHPTRPAARPSPPPPPPLPAKPSEPLTL